MTKSNWRTRGTATALIAAGLVLVILILLASLREPQTSPEGSPANEAGHSPAN
ncbi:hypothetical protein [Frigidibacter sp. MR17.24]|uniref:hypothetical protein n=1 Tax=Frigidibacter sp. MR17.24 TaxID=3127345 RepID=UPI003012D002